MVTRRERSLARPMPDRVDWEVLGPDFYRAWGYPNGKFSPEHVAIVGPTGSGKSMFEREILMERARLRGTHTVVIATKPADATLQSMGWPIVTSWPPKRGWRKRDQSDQVIFWAKAGGLSKEGRARQSDAVEHLLSQLWVPRSNRVVAFDEEAYIEGELGLKAECETYWREARALGITIVASTQRPAHVTRYFHSEATWRFFFCPADEEDAKRMAQTAGDEIYYREVLAQLNRDKHEFLVVNNRTKESCISRLDIRHTAKAPGKAGADGGGTIRRGRVDVQ